MKITEALKSLESSWSREDVLLKLKKGEDSEKIVNDFFNNNKQEIDTLSNFITKKDKVLLSEIENLSKIESMLINKIKNFSSNKNKLLKVENNKIRALHFDHHNTSFDFATFMMKWSNKFVFIMLIAISAIALTKQAWA